MLPSATKQELSFLLGHRMWACMFGAFPSSENKCNLTPHKNKHRVTVRVDATDFQHYDA
jgi:hypothetical protein